MGVVLSMALKDLRLLFRDRLDAFFTFIFPLLFGVFFGMVFRSAGTGPNGLAIALVNEDASPAAARFAQTLADSPNFRVTKTPTRAEAEAHVRARRALASVVIPEGFGDAQQNLFGEGGITLAVAVDPSRGAEGAMLEGLLTEAAYRNMIALFSNPAELNPLITDAQERLTKAQGLDPVRRLVLSQFLESLNRMVKETGSGWVGAAGAPASGEAITWNPVRIEMRALASAQRRLPANSFALTMPQAAAWGLMGCVVSFAVSLAAERKSGTLLRLVTAPVSHAQVIAGKGMACFLTALLVQAFLLAIAFVMGVRPTSYLALGVAVLASAFAFVGIMMLLAVLGRTEGGAGGIGRAAMLVLAMIGGGTLPLAFMPEWLGRVSNLSPFKWTILSLEGAIWRGLGWDEMALPLGVLVGIGTLGLGAGMLTFRWSHTR